MWLKGLSTAGECNGVFFVIKGKKSSITKLGGNMKLLKSTLWLLSTTVVSACFAEPTLTNSVGMEFIEVPAGTL